MPLENQWVVYLQRSYKSIKAALITRMQGVVPEITDLSESNVFVIIINSFAGLVEQLNYYIDNVARESFITTARRYSSLTKLTRLIDYRVRAKVGAIVDLRITAVSATEVSVALDDDETLDAGLIVEDSAGIQFITLKKVTLFVGQSSVIVSARQRVAVVDDDLGTTTAAADQSFEIADDYQHDTLQITINAVTWDFVKTFAFSGPEDKHFIVEVDENKVAWVVFGDDTNGEIPPAVESVLGTYYTCGGVEGNVEADTLTVWDTPVGGPVPPANVPAIDHYNVTNELPAVAGQDEEGIEGIRKHAPLSLRTLDRAVTIQDHIDICLLVPGVGKAATEFDDATKTITFYVAPDEGGTAPGGLLTDVEDYFDDKKMIASFVQALAAGETLLRMTLTVTVKFRRDTTQAEADIKEALQDGFGFNNSDVDREIRKSDIIALVDNLDKVDYLSLDILTTKPYPRIHVGVNPLESNWAVEVQSTSSEIASWRIAVITAANGGNGVAYVWRTVGEVEAQEPTSLVIHTLEAGVDWTSNDGTLKLSMWGTDFDAADVWTFKTYPHNEDIEFEDFTIPIYDVDELTLTVNEQVGI